MLFYTAGLLAVVYSKSSCLARLAGWQCSVGHAEDGGRKQKNDGNAQSDKLGMAAGCSGTMAMLSLTSSGWRQDAGVRWQCSVGQARDGGRMQ